MQARWYRWKTMYRISRKNPNWARTASGITNSAKSNRSRSRVRFVRQTTLSRHAPAARQSPIIVHHRILPIGFGPPQAAKNPLNNHLQENGIWTKTAQVTVLV